jgi:hypothetical protein
VPYLIKSSMGENTLMIGTDCGLGGRVHPQIAWPKLRPARRRGDREQEAGIQECLCGINETKSKKV